jgi:hypothetical protein
VSDSEKLPDPDDGEGWGRWLYERIKAVPSPSRLQVLRSRLWIWWQIFKDRAFDRLWGRYNPCPQCGGRGLVPPAVIDGDSEMQPCPYCQGKGWVWPWRRGGQT